MTQIHEMALDEALVHFGVKGMRWGVRKTRDPSDVVTKENKKLAKVNQRAAFDIVGERRILEMFGPVAMSETKYNSLSDKDVRIRAGATFARVTARENEAFRSHTFMSKEAEDRLRYRAVMPGMGFLPKDYYEHTYKSTKTLFGPSEKARVDAFTDLMDKPVVQVGKKTMTGKQYLKKAGYRSDVKKLESQQLGLKYYHHVTSRGAMAKNEPMTTAYFKSLEKKGYNMLADDNDRQVLSKNPLILLNPNGSVKRMSVQRLTKQQINEAQKKFTVTYTPDPKG